MNIICQLCEKEIDRHGNAKYCVPCSKKKIKESNRKDRKKYYQKCKKNTFKKVFSEFGYGLVGDKNE